MDRHAAEGEHRPCEIDIHIGSRLRIRRTSLFLTQERVGTALGCSFQQVQKYERGSSRIGAARLFKLARILQVPVGFFFENLPDSVSEVPSLLGGTDAAANAFRRQMNQKETMELVRAYYRVRDVALRARILALIESLTPSEDDPPPPPA